ncbi:MAG: hypothetical protein ACRDIY_06685 [Chloroflexota bacterium]
MLPRSTIDSPKTPIQRLILARLTRMLRLEDEWRGHARRGDWQLRLIQKGIYSTYRDSLEADVAARARELIDDHRASEPS